jgi:hypothetical protein
VDAFIDIVIPLFAVWENGDVVGRRAERTRGRRDIEGIEDVLRNALFVREPRDPGED